MTDSHWRLCPPELDNDDRFLEAVAELHEELYRKHFLHDPMTNADVGFQLRALRRVESWRLVLVLTPWMLSRLMVPSRDPGFEIPGEWRAENRQGADYVLLGPKLSVNLLGTPQTVHLNYHPVLGHYLLQPIALSMTDYRSADEVFQAWNHVIQTRDRNMEKARRDCAWQKEVSRREFFGRLGKGRSED